MGWPAATGMSMRIIGALVEYAGGPFVLQELDLEEPRPDEVIVRIEAAGLCHTDLSVASGYRVPFPQLLGHEGAGVVESVGGRVATVAPGDHVVASFAWCGHCRPCYEGHPAYCSTMRVENFGGRRVDGSTTVHRGDEVVHANFFGQSSFATHALVVERHLVKIDRDVPFEVAAPLGCGLQTGAGAVLNALRLRADQSFGVFGVGTVGLAGLMAAKVCGASPRVAIEPVASRRELALELGATAAIDPFEGDLAGKVREASSGGLDAALDTSGNLDVIRSAFGSLRNQGSLVIVAADTNADIAVPGLELLSGRSLQGVVEGDSVPRVFIPLLLRLWREGLFPIERLVTRFPLEQIEEAVKATRTGEVVKPVLVPR
jgi:aryl-alcohol dehydrogenase